MSEKSLKNSDNSIKNLVHCYLEIINPVPSLGALLPRNNKPCTILGLTVHQVSTQSHDNCRSLPEINHIRIIFKE